MSDSLEAIYAEIPVIHCQRKCWDFCGPVDGAAEERRRIAERGFVIDPTLLLKISEVGKPAVHMCPALTPYGSCAVYEDRPLICRLWGVSEGMECPYGCVPERLLSRAEAAQLIARSVEVGGPPVLSREPTVGDHS